MSKHIKLEDALEPAFGDYDLAISLRLMKLSTLEKVKLCFALLAECRGSSRYINCACSDLDEHISFAERGKV